MKLYTGTERYAAHYFGVVKSLWGKTTLSWVDGVLQIPKPTTNDNNKENKDTSTSEDVGGGLVNP